ncbi:multicopper oxidase family protein [Microlunatus aurantiacus]|uniref:multicopper oxidase family protein n=1 Tax=Microlunatus aurantiacus TaxID=446786 RepID=UPI003CD073FC
MSTEDAAPARVPAAPFSDTRGPRGGRLSRRAVLGLAGTGAVVAVGAGLGIRRVLAGEPVGPADPAVAAAEARRPSSGRTIDRVLRARPTTVDLGGREVATWTYDGLLPAEPLRASVGDLMRVRLVNDLPQPTTIHWHGLALRNDMDGVPDLTMPAVAPGARFDYAFTVAHPGTYWFHPHVGPQLDTGLYAPLIVDDPAEPGRYDDEAVLVFDDWTDGWGDSPDVILARARRDGMGSMGMGDMGDMNGGGMGSGGMGMPTAADPLGSDTGDVRYPAHLVNGRLPAAPHVITARPGQRLRLRLINAGADTAYRFAVGGHRLSVTHTDGFPVEPVTVDTLIIGMGERYDVVVTTGDGVFPVVAVPEGKPDPAAFALLRTASSARPPADIRPPELTRQRLEYPMLQATPAAAVTARTPDRELAVTLSMADGGRRWLINGKAYGQHDPLPVRSGERVRLVIDNRSMMFHPLHLHGHTFSVAGTSGRGFRKDTINVLPMQRVSVDFDADNPGQWLSHCHNIYHGELGMMTVLSYRS